MNPASHEKPTFLKLLSKEEQISFNPISVACPVMSRKKKKVRPAAAEQDWFSSLFFFWEWPLGLLKLASSAGQTGRPEPSVTGGEGGGGGLGAEGESVFIF